ncbi:hypothetical protein GCM10023354_20520 [Garicola koreensis]
MLLVALLCGSQAKQDLPLLTGLAARQLLVELGLGDLVCQVLLPAPDLLGAGIGSTHPSQCSLLSRPNLLLPVL